MWRTEIHLNSNGPVINYVKVKVKEARHRPGVAQRVPGSEGSQISGKRHRIVVRLSALRTGRIYPQEFLLVLISVISTSEDSLKTNQNSNLLSPGS
jgi:hypothetical protein